MSPPSDKPSQEEGQDQTSQSTGQPSRNAPLVIVSERGRHSDESRRIVRAQAARASAAQSRVTRARNREEREGVPKDGPLSPGSTAPTPSAEPISPEASSNPASQLTEHPLIKWLVGLMDLSPAGLLNSIQTLTLVGPAAVGAVTSTVASGIGGVLGGLSSLAGMQSEPARPQLPQAVPRGFTTLQQRIQISDTVIVLVSRTSCFDFGSPGVEERLHQLLFDIIISHAKALLTPILVPGHAIQGHLRIACTCLTIFQGQRANGSVFAHDSKYQTGLEAAWSEATLLDLNALAEPKSAEASLWAVFIISVTTGATANYFHQLLQGLFQDLQLRSWFQVRNILLDFIYPVSFLDEPCKSYFDSLQSMQIGAA
ncbi:uncharacterized protein LTR77_002587 [Saxophila tyrrhenica]|uniref:Uncharacterized protein n=1 Tax=Saxophila tyrrhenica TaxID=1690608 RepID=A0AAV9PNQ2_9PEZI|nr:hypothetical protein LTR77_002587 [Saxophila tyrrhenica]